MSNTTGKTTYYTEEGLKKLKDELEFLKTKERPSISQQIAEARDKGDLSENAEYDAAKNAQGMLEMRISKLEDLVMYARLIDKSKLDISKVAIMSVVKIKNTKNNAIMTYTFVSETEADLKAGKIAINTPIGKALLGKKIGDIVEVVAPAGVITFEIIEISL
ncbi:MAG: transcription elongation factor GreA [Bacteroidota bacterium]